MHPRSDVLKVTDSTVNLYGTCCVIVLPLDSSHWRLNIQSHRFLDLWYISRKVIQTLMVMYRQMFHFG